MANLKFCSHCGDPVDPGDDKSVNAKRESVSKKGWFHGPCWNAVLKDLHDSEAFHQ